MLMSRKLTLSTAVSAFVVLTACASPEPPGPSATQQTAASLFDDAAAFVDICLPITEARDHEARRTVLEQSGFSARPLGWNRTLRGNLMLNSGQNPDRPCVMSYSEIAPRRLFMQPAIEAELLEAGFRAVSDSTVQVTRSIETKEFTNGTLTITLRSRYTSSDVVWSLSSTSQRPS